LYLGIVGGDLKEGNVRLDYETTSKDDASKFINNTIYFLRIVLLRCWIYGIMARRKLDASKFGLALILAFITT
jgi:hypothetical protein